MRRGAPDPETLTTEEALLKESEIARSGRYAVRVYWLALTICGFITCVVSMAMDPREPLVGPLIVGIFLPAGQIAASIITFITIKVRPPVRIEEALRRLGRISLFAFLFGLLGVVGTVLTLNFM